MSVAFHEHYTAYQLMKSTHGNCGKFSAREFYLLRLKEMGRLEVIDGSPVVDCGGEDNLHAEMLMSEQCYYEGGRPYFKVYPAMCGILSDTRIDIHPSQFRSPFVSYSVLFPKGYLIVDSKSGSAELASAMVHFCGTVYSKKSRNVEDGRYHMGLFSSWILKEGSDMPSHFLDIPKRFRRAMITWSRPIGSEDTIEEGISPSGHLFQGSEVVGHEEFPYLTQEHQEYVARVAISCALFGTNQHELILPDIPRKFIDRYTKARREGDEKSKKEIERKAKKRGMNGFIVGSEIDLPVATVRYHEKEAKLPSRELSFGHLRRGHMALVACGAGRKDRKLVFRHPALVRPDLPMSVGRGYRIGREMEKSK